MLSRAAARALAGRTSPASLRFTPTSGLARHYAKDNRPPNARRPPIRDSKQGQGDPARFGGFGGSATVGKQPSQSGAQSRQDASQEINSRTTAELDEKSTPRRNTEPLPRSPAQDQRWKKGYSIKFANTGAATAGEAQASSKINGEAAKQDARSRETAEFDQAASPTRNTEPSSQPGPGPTTARSAQNNFAAETPDAQDEASSSQQPTGPLPDLRQGLPSTFEAEFLKRAESEQEGRQDLDITEAKETEDPASAGEGGRGGDRELPRSAYESSVDRRRNNVAYYAYLIMATIGVTGAVYFGRNWANEEEERAHPDAPSGWNFILMWKRIKARLSGQVSYYTEPAFEKLLPDMDPNMRPPMTLVLSLEDLLIHSEWTREHGWRMAKRPGLDYFLRYLSQYYELAIFTSIPSQTGIPVIQKLDPFHVVMWPLFREATRYENGQYIKVSCW